MELLLKSLFNFSCIVIVSVYIGASVDAACEMKQESMQTLLKDSGVVACIVKEDFNITICEGVCDSLRVSTIDFDYRRINKQNTSKCCDGDGEVKTVVIKCLDVKGGEHSLEHNVTFTDYNVCKCTTCGRPSLKTTCGLKPESIQTLLTDSGVPCIVKEDFNITICEGVCDSRRVATIDFDYRRIIKQNMSKCCDGDGVMKSVVVKCLDVKGGEHSMEHSVTYTDYNVCKCTTCGLVP